MDGAYPAEADLWSNGDFWIRYRAATTEFDMEAGWVIQDAAGEVRAFMPQLLQVLPAAGLWRSGMEQIQQANRLPKGTQL